MLCPRDSGNLSIDGLTSDLLSSRYQKRACKRSHLDRERNHII